MKTSHIFIVSVCLYGTSILSMHANRQWEQMNKSYEQNRQQVVQYQAQQQVAAQNHMAQQSQLNAERMTQYQLEQQKKAEEAAFRNRR